LRLLTVTFLGALLDALSIQTAGSAPQIGDCRDQQSL